MAQLQLCYWDLRGFGEPIRLMLEYLGANYVNEYPASPDAWFAKKYHLNMKYPNLPYLVDGKNKVTQSYAIMRYLSRKYKCLGASTEEEMTALDQAEGYCSDLRGAFGGVCGAPQSQARKAQYVRELPAKLKGLEDVLRQHKWASGNRLAYIDFAICENLDQQVLFAPNCLDNSPNVKKYKEAFDALPQVAAYRRSGRYKQWPVTGGAAVWGQNTSPL